MHVVCSLCLLSVILLSFHTNFGWSVLVQSLLLSIMHGRSRQVNRCHHNLAAPMIASNLTSFVFPCTWHFLYFMFYSFLLQFLLWYCTALQSLKSPRLSPVWYCWVSLWPSPSVLHRPFLALYSWSSVRLFLFIAILSSLRSLLLAISSSFSFQWTNFVANSSPILFHHRFFVVVSSSLFLRRRFFLSVSFSPLLHSHFFFAISSSLFFRRHFFVAISSSPFHCYRSFIHCYFVAISSSHFLVTISSSPFIHRCFSPALFSAPPHRHHFSIALFHHCFFVTIILSQSHGLRTFGSIFPSVFRHRCIPACMFFAVCPSQFLDRHFFVGVFFVNVLLPQFLGRHFSITKSSLSFFWLHFFIAFSSSHSHCCHFLRSVSLSPFSFGVNLLTSCLPLFHGFSPSPFSVTVSRLPFPSPFFIVIPRPFFYCHSPSPSPILVAISCRHFSSPFLVAISRCHFQLPFPDTITCCHFLSALLVGP